MARLQINGETSERHSSFWSKYYDYSALAAKLSETNEFIGGLYNTIEELEDVDLLSINIQVLDAGCEQTGRYLSRKVTYRITASKSLLQELTRSEDFRENYLDSIEEEAALELIRD